MATKLHVRPMTQSDVSEVARVAAAAFKDDELMVWMAPGRDQHADVYQRWCIERQHSAFHRPGLWGAVCVDENDRILGYSWWERFVAESQPHLKTSDPWLRNNKSVFHVLERALQNIAMKYHTAFGTYRPAMDLWRTAQFHNLEPNRHVVEKNASGWYLAVLGVSPQAQRMGIGGLLLDWGIDRARREATETGVSVPITLMSSPLGIGLYKKKGFKIVDWIDGTITPEMLDSGFLSTGGQICIWDPEETWAKEAPPGTVNSIGKPVDVVWTERTLQ